MHLASELLRREESPLKYRKLLHDTKPTRLNPPRLEEVFPLCSAIRIHPISRAPRPRRAAEFHGELGLDQKDSYRMDFARRVSTRRHFDEDAIKELANSIRERGMILPIMVRAIEGEKTATRLSRVSAAGAPRRSPDCTKFPS
jgi:hypothetical protein